MKYSLGIKSLRSYPALKENTLTHCSRSSLSKWPQRGLGENALTCQLSWKDCKPPLPPVSLSDPFQLLQHHTSYQMTSDNHLAEPYPGWLQSKHTMPRSLGHSAVTMKCLYFKVSLIPPSLKGQGISL